ncbi:hypothetical protein GQ53DRAFT_774258 [Thozetella sp. PMI_491]|nr:hypothetical protein GQ53DRAFT_774258 [Thozetella sp. PMI_491]
MRAGKIFTVALRTCLLFASPGSAYRVRGAAEMSLYYITYMLEDIHFNKDAYDGWKIAPDCVGDLKGLWGQKGRYNFAQFMDYVWAQTKTDVKDGKGNIIEIKYDTKPKAENIKWAKYNDGSSVARKDTIPKAYGYTGNVDKTKFFPADNLDYFGALQRFGPRAVQLQKDLEGAKNNGEILNGDPNSSKYKSQKATYDKFNTLYEQAKTAASIIMDLRKQDSWRHIVDMTKWHDKLGIDKPATKPIHPQNSMGGDYEEVDRDGTINKMVNERGISKDQATREYDAWWSDQQSSTSYKGHQATIFGAEETLHALQVGAQGGCKP